MITSVIIIVHITKYYYIIKIKIWQKNKPISRLCGTFLHFNVSNSREQFLKSHPASMPFSEKNITCIKIELKDIRELPRKYWYLGNNSFLLHGFFNYRYLVLGKIEEDNEDKWFLGVPGIYQNQERVMAIIFGFPEFMPEQVENRFGCWYRFIEE